MLVAQNAVRASVGVPPLEWSGQLAARAQDWADSLLARRRLSHRADSPYGENLFGISGAAASPSMVVDNWARESRDYDYRKNRCNGVCGHFTPIVWVQTNRLAYAFARGGAPAVSVCQYYPPS